MFDYASSDSATIESQFYVEDTCALVLKNSFAEQSELPCAPDAKFLANIGKIRDHYMVFKNERKDIVSGEELWHVLRRNAKNVGVKLHVGDILKFGRCKFFIKELVLGAIDFPEVKIEIVNENEDISHPDNTQILTQLEMPKGEASPNRKDTSVPLFPVEEEKVEQKEEPHCRVCLGAENTSSNPLIQSPCKCTGSVQLIHIECLQQWLKSKITEKKMPLSIAYMWKDFECDICRAKYPSNLHFNYHYTYRHNNFSSERTRN